MSNTSTKPNCYKCEHRRTISGDAHSRCDHPVARLLADPLTRSFVALMGKTSNVGELSRLNIKANQHGIDRGWFIWPVNFDPVWLENCDGFEEKDSD